MITVFKGRGIVRMQARDKIGKAVWNICESCKEVVSTNLVLAVRDGHLKLDEAQQAAVVGLVNSLIDQAFHRSYNNFLKSVDAAIVDSRAGVPPT
jgi:hypothetical protein